MLLVGFLGVLGGVREGGGARGGPGGWRRGVGEVPRPGGLDSPGVADPVRSGWPVPWLLGISR